MRTDVNKLIQTLAQSDLYHGRGPEEAPPRPVVTVARDHGAGGRRVTELLAERLGVEIYDREILDAIAQGAHTDTELMERLDEKIGSHRDTWIYQLLTGQNAYMASYRHHLVNVCLGIAHHGGVIVGRGAHLVLTNYKVFRLRIVGSEEKCAGRLARRQEMDFDAAVNRVREVNRERDKFLWSLFKHHLDEPATFDLIVNTDQFGDDLEPVAKLVLRAMESFEFPLVKKPERSHE